MRLLGRPHCVVLPVRLPERVVLTRLVIFYGVQVTEVVTGVDFLTIHMRVFADTLKVDLTIYPTLLVVRLSVTVFLTYHPPHKIVSIFTS